MSDIETRLAAVERSVRRRRYGAAALGVALVAAVAAGAQRQAPAVMPEVVVRRLVVVDQQDRPVVVADSNQHGGRLTALQADQAFFQVSAQRGGALLDLKAPTQPKSSISLAAAADKGGMVAVNHSNGELGCLVAAKNGSGHVVLYDDKGKTISQKP